MRNFLKFLLSVSTALFFLSTSLFVKSEAYSQGTYDCTSLCSIVDNCDVFAEPPPNACSPGLGGADCGTTGNDCCLSLNATCGGGLTGECCSGYTCQGGLCLLAPSPTPTPTPTPTPVKTLTVSSSYPWPVAFNDPPVTCDYPVATFKGTGLDPAQTYYLCEECVDCSTAGLPTVIYTHGFPTSSFTFNRSYDPGNACNNGGAVKEPGAYFATLYQNGSCTSPVTSDEFYYLLANTCTLNPQYPISPQPGSGNILLTNNNPYLVDYSINIFPAGACTYSNSITVPANSTGTIQVSCTTTNGIPHQMSLISSDMNNYPDLCGAVFTVGESGGASCKGEATGFFPGACVSNSIGCKPPTKPDGQSTCAADEICCVFGDPTDPPDNVPCTSIGGNEGVCYFILCPDGSRMEFDGFPPNAECPLFYGCCVPIGSSGGDTSFTDTSILCEAGGVNTAIGCIEFGNINTLSGFWLKFFIGLSGGVAMLLIVLGGFMIATSAGNPAHVKSGRDLIIAALSGLLMTIFSVYLLELIGVRILNLPGL